VGAQGQTTVDFGTYPGANDTSVAVTGQTGILSTSLVEAWLALVATSDHTIGEHLQDGPIVFAGAIVAGTGFTIYAKPRYPSQTLYGQYTVNWVWN